MENYEQPLSPEELKKLMDLIQQQQESGELSSDFERVSIVSSDGVKRTRRESISHVSIGEDSVPTMSRDINIYRLDCGHPPSDPSKTQSCDFGHHLCLNHDLIACSKCRRVMCFKDIDKLYEWGQSFEDVFDFEPICKECKGISWLGIGVVGVILLVVIIVIGLVAG